MMVITANSDVTVNSDLRFVSTDSSDLIDHCIEWLEVVITANSDVTEDSHNPLFHRREVTRVEKF